MVSIVRSHLDTAWELLEARQTETADLITAFLARMAHANGRDLTLHDELVLRTLARIYRVPAW